MINLHQTLSHLPSCSDDAFDDCNHRPMVVSNEINHKETVDAIIDKPIQGNLMIAVSCFFALDVVSVRKNIKYLLILDRGVRVNHFWWEIQEIIENTCSRKLAIEKIINLIFTNHHIYFSGGYLFCSLGFAQYNTLCLSREIKDGTSWLSEEGRYNRIRSLFLANRIAVKQLNLCEPNAMNDLGKILKIHKLSVDIFYLSNVRQYAVEEKKLTLLYKSVKPLLTPQCYLVDAHVTTLKNAKEALLQRISQKGSTLMRSFLKPPSKKIPIKKTALKKQRNFQLKKRSFRNPHKGEVA